MTMSPEEIRRLPVDRSKPFNGLTEAQVRAIGEDPQQVEAARLSHVAWAGQKQRDENVQLVAAAQHAVESGDLTQAEAAEALRAAGKHEALDAFVTLWLDEERSYEAQEAAEGIPWLDADSYAAHVNAQRAQERAAAEAEAADLRRQLAEKQVEELQADFEATLGGHALAPQVGQRLIDKLKASDSLPSTAAERATVIEEALREVAVISDKTQSIRQEVEDTWRISRKPSLANGWTRGDQGLTTREDVDRAKAIYSEARFNQRADATLIDTEALRPGPTAAEESAALAEKYRSRQNFARQAGEMAKRGAETDARRDRGEGISEEKDAYREAIARAEAEARNAEIKSGYGANAVQARAGGYGPDGTWPDELGPAGYS